MLPEITTEVSDKKLQAELKKFNGLVTIHRKRSETISEALEAADVVTVTTGAMDKLKADRSVARLETLQDAVRIEEQRMGLIEKLQPELDKAANAADAELQTTIQTVADHMDAAGFGLDSMPAAAKGFDRIAQRQFDQRVHQADPVKLATENLSQARSVATKNLDAVRQSAERLELLKGELNAFVKTYLNN